jgi:XRE family transcriptional regulator, aerobic/anaerobic benzoate catabolism transcriptional regulator
MGTISHDRRRPPALPPTTPQAPQAEASALLRRVGAAIRARRLALGATAEETAKRAGLSRRFLAMVEAGSGNISLLNLAALCRSLGLDLAATIAEGTRGASAPKVVALLGLRGAGKSTLGPAAAAAASARFVELDALVEKRAGLSLAEIFSVHGEEYFRRLEFEVLRDLVDSGDRLVVATGGGIVASKESTDLLKSRCATVWLKASPEQHWNRVAEQGDRRPFDVRVDARAALRAILRRRAPLYAAADHVVDTSRGGVAASRKSLEDLVVKILS